MALDKDFLRQPIVISIGAHLIMFALVAISVSFASKAELVQPVSLNPMMKAVVIDSKTISREMKKLAKSEKRREPKIDVAQVSEPVIEPTPEPIKEIDTKKEQQKDIEIAKKKQEEEVKQAIEKERIEVEKRQQEKLAQEKLLQEKLVQDKLVKEKLLQEKMAQEKLLKAQEEKVAQEKMAQEKQLKAQEEKKAQEKAIAQKKEAEKLAAAEKDRILKEFKDAKAKEDAKRASDARMAAERELQQMLANEASAANAQATGSEVDHYKSLISQRLHEVWTIPYGLSKDLVCIVKVRLMPSGDLIDVRVIQSSGNSAFDHSATLAVEKAAPLPVPSNEESMRAFREFSFTFGENIS